MVARGDILSGRYLVGDPLGSGGMGAVYQAVDLRTGADVAVKIPHDFLARDEVFMERLRREAQIAASLSSPRVARVTDFTEHEGMTYLVMELVPGETLAERLEREGPLPAADALHLTLEVSRALEAAHQRGITHRDLKPENIRLNGNDIKVLDFGLAHLEGLSGLTAANYLIGSPAYIAPERLEGAGDIRSDIYSLGVVMYEMLTGRRPFDGATPATVLRQVATEPPAPLPPNLPDPVYPIIDRCLAKSPSGRYETPRDLSQALIGAITTLDRGAPATHAPPPRSTVPQTIIGGRLTEVAEEPSAPRPAAALPTLVHAPAGRLPSATIMATATPPPAPPPLDRTASTRRGPPWPVIAGVGAAAVALIIVVVLLTRGGDDQASQQTSAATQAVATTGAGGASAPAGPTGSPPTLSIVFPADGATVTMPVRIDVKVDGAVLKPPVEQDPNARHLHYFLDADPAPVVGPGLPVPTGVQGIIHSPATSLLPDLAPGKHTVWVVLTDNNHVPLSPNVQSKASFTVTGTPPRGGSQAPIVYQSLVDGKWRLFVMDGLGRGARRLSFGAWDDIEPSWSPDGARIVFVSNRDGRFHLYAMNADGGGVQPLTRGDFDDRAPAWSSDGRQIAFTSDRDGGRGQVFIIPATGGDAIQMTRGAGSAGGPTWSPDSKQIAFYREQGDVTQIFAIDAGGGEPKQLTSAIQRHIDPAWSPDGRRIAFAGFRDNRWNVFVMNADGSDIRQATNEDVNRNPAWSPDGRELVFVSGREGQQQVFVLPLEGAQIRRLTEGLVHNLHPSWPRR